MADTAPNASQADNARNRAGASSRPSDFLRARRPELFSDSTLAGEPQLTQAVLEYQLSTLTSRKQEIEFEHFCRRLAEKELCPNLLPQTGPTGGGDSKVDTETYPVADEISLRWYMGNPHEAGTERWAFAFSAKKEWRSKIRGDVNSIVSTGRKYSLIYFMTNQFVKDKDRASMEDSLTSKYNIAVRILDRSWLIKSVFEHGRVSLAVDALHLTGYENDSRRSTGPNDLIRAAELGELEKKIADPERYQGVEYQLAEDCLDAALLSRQLEHSRVEIEGRFARAERIAKKVNHSSQRLRIVYERALTAFWWFNDFDELNELYDQVETLALGSSQAADLHRLGTLLTLVRNSVRTGNLDVDPTELAERTAAIRAVLEPMAADKSRPSNALWARANALMLELSAAAGDSEEVGSVLRGLTAVMHEAEGLASFPLAETVKTLTGLGDFLSESPAYDELFEAMTTVMARRVSEAEAGRLLSMRGFQKIKASQPYDAIRLFGRAQLKLALREHREQFVTTVFGCGLAYLAVGLPWAARANFLAAASYGLSEFSENGIIWRSVKSCLLKVAWAELRLGRVFSILQWVEARLAVELSAGHANSPVGDGWSEQSEQDRALGIVFLKADVEALKALDFLPAILEGLGLDYARMALLYALGYEDELRKENIIPESENSEAVVDYFRLWAESPVVSAPEPMNGSTVELRSAVLGCDVVAQVQNTLASVSLGEAVLAGLEALLATSLELATGAFPYQSEFKIRVAASDSVLDQSEFHFDADRALLTISHNAEILARIAREPRKFQEWLQDVVVQLAAHLLLTIDPISYAKRVFGDERGLGRAFSFADPSIPINNILGRDPKFRLVDWEPDEATARFPMRRSDPWSARPPQWRSLIEQDAARPIAGVHGHRRDPKLEMTHDERRVFSLINMSLWSRAKWNAILYLLPVELDRLPILAFGFGDLDAGRSIFREWREKVGEVDEYDQLRLSIVKGIDRNRPYSYRVVIGTNSRASATEGLKEVVEVSRIHRMNPPDSRNIEGFASRLKRLTRYLIVPAAFEDMNTEPEVDYNLWIGKKTLSIRDAWEVSLNDPDAIGISADDEPIFPEGIADPPGAKVLERARTRKAGGS